MKNTVRFYSSSLSPEMKQLKQKVETEFSHVDVSIIDETPQINGTYDQRFSAIANDIVVTGDSTHVLFERIKNIIGEREVDGTRY